MEQLLWWDAVLNCIDFWKIECSGAAVKALSGNRSFSLNSTQLCTKIQYKIIRKHFLQASGQSFGNSVVFRSTDFLYVVLFYEKNK